MLRELLSRESLLLREFTRKFTRALKIRKKEIAIEKNGETIAGEYTTNPIIVEHGTEVETTKGFKETT